MMLIWRWIKIWLFIGMLYAVYYLIRSALALKRVEISRNSWDAKS
jgi:sugar phosphate permease